MCNEVLYLDEVQSEIEDEHITRIEVFASQFHLFNHDIVLYDIICVCHTDNLSHMHADTATVTEANQIATLKPIYPQAFEV